MQIDAFAIFDSKLGAYLVPQFFANAAVAERACALALQRGDFQTPEDYTLYRIGTWDDEKGELTALKPEYVRRLEELKPQHNASVTQIGETA